MGFFSKVRKRIKKIIPKEVRPFLPYLAAMIPGGQLGLGTFAQSNPAMYKALMAGGTRFATDDEADLKDVGITSALAAAPQMLGDFAGPTGPDPNTFKGMLQGGARTLADAGPLTTLGTQGSIDYGIKAAELNKDALAKYNADLAAQGIKDRAGRRSAIRKIYENTGTWDMDEVDTMLDTYGYRTGGRVGYADGNYVPEDQRKDPDEVIAGMDNELNPSFFDMIPLIGGYEGKYPVDKDQGSDLINEIQKKKYGYDYEGEEIRSSSNPERPPMSMEETIAALEAKWDEAVEDDWGFGYFDYMGVYEKEDIRRRVELGFDQAKGPITDTGIMRAAHGGRVGLKNGSNPKKKKRTVSMSDLIEATIKDDDEDDDKELLSNIGHMQDAYGILYPETPENKIRPLSFADGGSTSNYSKLMARVKELQDEGLDFGSAMQQAIKELGTPFARGGGVMDGLDINLREQIDTPTGDEMIDENIEVADSTLMDAYEIYKFEMLEQGLEPMSLEQFRDQAIAESKMASAGSWESEWEDIYQNYKAKQIELGLEFVDKETFMMDYQDNMAKGGRVGYDEGGIGKWVKKKIKKKIKPYTKEGRDEFKKEWLEKKNIDMTVKEWNALSLKEKAKIWFREGSAQGGRIGYRFGEEVQTEKGSIEGHRAGPEWFTKRVEQLMYEGYSYEEASEIAYEEGHGGGAAKGGRVGAQEGGLMNLGGREMDLRGGGFVPIGKKERADDVPARLSKNEFVMTADAVRAAGGGNVQKGSHLMYDQMKQLEGQA